MKKCIRSTKNVLIGVYYSSDSNDRDNNNGQNIRKQNYLEPPEEPTTCCMSGCANCVWLEYAEALSKYYHDGGEKAIQEINERINDPNIKAYILHEIRMRSK
ncbi:oxidoreductase-like domain-containing protein 1 [Rhynchophorus ferrugineus]|uniref:oxidoreductase-like domain-containing protein 1 n=1 Tax=Rhynchophorus ferrugineus TaxID=354439 RepID=UPI003FCD37BD